MSENPQDSEITTNPQQVSCRSGFSREPTKLEYASSRLKPLLHIILYRAADATGPQIIPAPED
jgi:hypothetical protein